MPHLEIFIALRILRFFFFFNVIFIVYFQLNWKEIRIKKLLTKFYNVCKILFDLIFFFFILLIPFSIFDLLQSILLHEKCYWNSQVSFFTWQYLQHRFIRDMRAGIKCKRSLSDSNTCSIKFIWYILQSINIFVKYCSKYLYSRD